MNAQADRVNIVRRSGGRGRLLAGAGVAALTLALLHAAPVRAAEYLVANDAQLRAAITAANADADPSATIVLTGSFAVANTNLPLVTKPITIDTRGFTLTGATTNATAVRVGGPYTTGSLTLDGAILGVSGGVASTVIGGSGLQVSVGASVTNNGTITGGAGGQAGGSGGRGVVVTGVNSTLVNNGTITAGISYSGGTSIAGVQVIAGGTLVNNGVIQGANSPGGFSGVGVDLGSAAAPSTLVNNGIIRGGSGSSGSSNVGLVVRVVNQPVINTGAIEGGDGSVAVTATGGSSVTLINSGALRAGAGQAAALQMGTGQLTLELQSGSVIQGNVVASAAGTTDILRLGGATSATFDVSTIGATRQYQNFDVFQKVGTGAWTLTGTGTATTNWDIQQGVLVIGDGGTSGSIIGNVANAGTLAFNRSDSVSFGGVISGTGAVRQSGSGTTTLTGVNTYTGGTFLDGGTLSVGSDANLGGPAGALNFNGGVLRWTGGSFVSTRAINWGANGGGFDVTNGAAVLRVNPALAGGGALTKLGGGTLVLAGDNTYAGGTTIAAGTLQIGGGGASGSILGDVVNNGALAFGRSDATTFAGAITGTGSVSQIGAGTITLTGNSNYGGTTNVSGGGGLRILGATVSSGASPLVSGGSLTVDAGGVFNSIGGTVQSATGVAGVMNVRNGGAFHTTGNLTLRNAPSGIVLSTLNVSGAGSLADIGGGLLIAASGSTNVNGVNITGGGKLTTGGATTMGAAAGNTTAPFITIDGAGSDWTSANALTMTNGVLSLTNGGAASFTTVTTGTVSAARQGAVTVTGVNSHLTTTGDLVIGSGAGTGSLTLADGGLASVGGSILLGNGATATGVLNIGGAEGQAAAGTGAFNAASLVFGGVGSRINFNHTDPAYGFATLLSGAGAVNQVAGTTILTANNSYSGATTVSGGLLRINGDQSAATGLTSVLSGGALGGGGIVGGSVTIANGGTLAPGNSPGTLTIAGDLSLASGSLLDYEFGHSNVVGGPLNDLTVVGGNLTLDGTINVTVTPGGNFDTGVYRILSYGGALTDNGLALGAMPAGSVVGVQTSVAGQVNLVNSAGATVNFWDGAAGPKLDGFVNGGNGVWQNSTGNDNWTDITGTFNNAYSDGSFAVFMAAPGTVTVDNGLGAVSVSGMQFASNGYTITGGDIALTGPQSVVRVGVGAAVGAGFTATIASGLTGASQLVKTDLGTLVLTGANSYTGGTQINTGTLQIGDGGTTGGVTGAIVDNAALVVNRSNGVTLDGAISGTGSLTKLGAGTLTLTGAGTYTGGTTITAGMLQIGDGGTTGGVAGDIVDNGALRFNRSNTLTLGGVISGSGSVSQAGPGTTILTGANSYAGATDVTSGTLLINGDQSGATALTSVASGATLGGVGTIGGNVTVADGATLAAGSNGVGTLAINGDLTLGGASRIAFEFGQAGVVGGAFNDLVNVGGALTLDGTIDVTQSAGGSYGAGVYRVINYAGGLTDNGLTIGAQPTGADVFVQTSVAGQVNLVNVGGLDLNFWDGAAGPKFDGVINGGGGVWQAHGGNDNWADASGAVNAGYSDGAVAIFSGAPGTVTVSNTLGAVTASGLQFASDGYVITGQTVTLTGPQASIRVGDGTVGGSAYTATIDAQIAGAAQLVKTDLGTLVLAGANSFTGGVAINGGTLRIASDANLGAAAGGLSFNGGTLDTTADVSSARAVNLAGQAVFSTDAGTTTTLTGNITGAGGLGKADTGTLVLAGAGSYTGGATVGQGTLLVNGDHGAATGLMTIGGGATLGGTGTIGGDVILNGTLAPGAGSVGTLTINGDLAIGSTAILAYEFGQANVTGGALNDLVKVGGDLTLDGTINVTVPASGAFGAGIYRVFNYGGALTDNGLTLGALPAAGAVTVQTSIAGQVNLVNASGLALSFWDGAGGPKNNGAINGGAGVWQAGGAADNWTDAGGAVNAAYSNSAFAVFAGTSGTVTVDNGLGQVSAAGLQFATGGYTITGGAVALTGSQATIRVGDGSTAGAGYTTTINAALSGAAQLAKTDAGTLVLGGTNSYAGGTLINGGVLQISSDANLGEAAGTVTFDGGTLATSASLSSARGFAAAGAGAISTAGGTTLTLTGPLSGAGTLTKTGGGTLLLTGDGGAHGGATLVGAGILRVDGVLGGATTVTAGGRLEGVGRVGSVVNLGVVAPGGDALGTLTLAGGYAGNGGTLEIAAALGGDASPTDRLMVNGDTSGATEVVLTNRNGLGAQTVEGVKIVDVAGASNGAFTLRGDYQFQGSPAVIAGAYGYRLYKGGVATPADGDWYLRSALLSGAGAQVPLYQPGVPVYEAYGQTLLALNAVGTMQQRIGERRWGTTESGQPSGLWGRVQANRYRPNATVSTSLADLDVDSWTLEFGADRVLSERQGATLVLGVLAGLGEAEAKIGSVYGDGGVKTKDYSVGATLSWYGPRGFYVDSQVRTTWFDSDLRSTVLGALTDGNDGHGQTYSVELGKRSSIDAKLSVTPQVQMVYSTVGFDRFADPNDAEVSSGRGESLKTRWGLAIDRQDANSHLYAVGNLSYEWRDGTVSNVSGTPIKRANDRLWGELGVGGTVILGSLRLYTEASADTALNDFGYSYSLKGTVGLRLAF